MPKVSKESASQADVLEGVLEDRSEELDGYTASFTTFLSDMDDESLFKGLPDDRCQCPHWGYMLKGKITFRFADRQETYERAMLSTCRPDTSPSCTREASSSISAQPTSWLRRWKSS
jgi:hypothetical protein